MRKSRYIFIIALFSIIFFKGFGQVENRTTARQIIEIANDAYFNLRIILIANEQYKLAAEMAPDNIEANYMAGRTSLQTYKKADAITKGDNLRDVSFLIDETLKDEKGIIHYIFSYI